MRHKFTPEECRRGGLATAAKTPPPGYNSFMAYVGSKGLHALAKRYTGGCIAEAGRLLSHMGNYVSDPYPENGAWDLPHYVPGELRYRLNQKRRRFGDGYGG